MSIYAPQEASHSPALFADGPIVFEPASPAIGAFVVGVDLSEPLDATTIRALNTGLARYGVLFFRDQNLAPKQQIAFAEKLGEIEINRFFKASDAYPEIAEVRKEPNQKVNIGGGWHTDHSYDQIPAKASLLYAIDLPPLGGDTLFASTEAAYDALSPGLQQSLSNLCAVHSSRHVFGHGGRVEAAPDLRGRILNPEQATQEAVHSVIFTHPVTKRKSLYVNPGFVLRFEGWTEAESAGLLATLYAHIQQPEFSYRFQWRPGSLAFWDNRLTWHLALNDYQGARRLLHRITIKGDPSS